MKDQEEAQSEIGLLDRAVRLFEFLARVQQVTSQTPRTIETYERDGDVLWFHALPDHPAVKTSHRSGELDPSDPILTIDRVSRIAPPAGPSLIEDWLRHRIDNPEEEPTLVDQRVVEIGKAEDGSTEVETQRVEDHPHVVEAYERWLPSWRVWANAELSAMPVREVYGRLFSIHLASTNNPEEMEVICGLNCLAWQPDGHDSAQRHVFAAAGAVEFDDETGRLTVRAVESMDTLSLELDMLDPAVVRDPLRINEIRDAARTLDAHILDMDQVSLLGRRLVHCLDPDGQYLDSEVVPTVGDKPTISYAPALILRKRSQQGLVQVFEAIASQIRDAGQVPEGLLPLIDPNHRPDPGLTWEGADGAIVAVDEEVFLPLPLNEAQLRVIRRVDGSAQTLVQGPPGTGKTHTAAALISHLLAQGKRVLVTAKTDRALKEVRNKLPEAIKPLSVAIVGAGREDMADLKIAVERIAGAAADYEEEVAKARIDWHLDQIDVLRRDRARVHHKLIEAREVEVRTHQRPGVTGTLAAIAQWYSSREAAFSWISDLAEPASDTDPPLTNAEVAEWRHLLLNESLRADESDAMRDLIDPQPLPPPEDFSRLVETEKAAQESDDGYSDVHDHDAFEAFMQLPAATRTDLQSQLRGLAEDVDALARRQEAWMGSALADIQQGRVTPWRARREEVAKLVSEVQPLLKRLGSVRQVRCEADPVLLVPIANALRAHLSKGGKLKTDAAGRPKVGALTVRVVKEAVPLFEAVSIDGVPPTTIADLDHLTTWVDAGRILAALDRAWPDGVSIPVEDTHSERLHWHVAELEQLERVIALAGELHSQDAALAELELRPMHWSDLDAVRRFGRVVEAVTARETLGLAESPLTELGDVLGEAARWRNAGHCVRLMNEAVQSRSSERYAEAWDRLDYLLTIRDLISRRDELGSKLEVSAPRLHSSLLHEPEHSRWDACLPEFSEAWAWAATGAWIKTREQVDVNLLQRQLDAADKGIRSHVEELAAGRAWRHAVSSDRMTGEARANLEQYAYLVRRLGRGTGRYATQRRSEIRQAMDRCRPSVPVWIMPIYRIAEQLRVAPDIFDVVVVDEASQAGLEATFLQYLAPKIVVIGDDKQVSPAAVGIDQQQLRDLAAQYLYDDSFRASWQDPQRSLFDEAKMRYGGMITLAEHRRCVPEIIGFSNRVAYEPEGIRLIPVRQYGADRLEPIRPVFLENGYARGSQAKINPVEVDAIVDQIEKCFADPTYDGLTFGVISLLGTAQAKQIEKALLERIPPEEWTARELRCGDSADFQGSERDVMFLSMVAAAEPDRRLAALTHQMFLQRYNVAASRARDQMWLYHSVELSELGNPQDLRFQLLDYCYATVARAAQVDTRFSNPVPEDVKVVPFDSLFEQRVFNRLIDRGYNVIPQYEVEGYRIDLVILGSKIKVAIECDGDAWHGPERYQADLARKRDLERQGWKFFNVRESLFYVDRAAALEPLWDLLGTLEVHPSGWIPPEQLPPSSVPSKATSPTTSPSPEHDGIDARQAHSHSSDEDMARRVVEPNIHPAEDPAPASLERAISIESEDEIATPAPDGAGHSDPVGAQDVAARLGVKAQTVAAWKERGMLPAPQWSVSGMPVWEWATIEEWARSTGRIEIDQLSRLEGDPKPIVPVRAQHGLLPYEEFRGDASPALQTSPHQLVQELVAIVAVEGPVLGARLHQSHVRAAGGARVGRQIAHALNAAITSAKKRGLLMDDNPLSDRGVKPMTYRLPSHPLTIVRELGPRSLEQVPPRELAAVMRKVATKTGWGEEHEVFRAVLDQYGLRRLTANVVAHLRRVRPLAEGSDPETE